MTSPLLASLGGRCPACREGKLYEHFLMLYELCPACGVRYERYVGTRTIATVLSFLVGAVAAFGFDRLVRGVGGPTWVLVPAAAVFGAVLYPIFRNLAVFLLWQNGLVTVDPPEREDARRPPPPLPEPYGPSMRAIVALPLLDDPTSMDEPLPSADDPTEDRHE